MFPGFIKNHSITIFLGIVLMITTGGHIAGAVDSGKNSHVLATVNGSPITDIDRERELIVMRQKIPLKLSAFPDSQMAMVKNEVLDRLIDFVLLYQETQRKGIVVGDAEISQHLQNLQSGFANQSAFTRYLDEMKLTETSARDYVRRELAVQRLVDTIGSSRPPAGEEEMKQYYDSHQQQFRKPEQIRVSHIVLRMSNTSTEQEQIEAIDKLGRIRDQIEKNEASFSELARSLSEDATAENGGELGYIQRGQLIKPFQDIAFTLAIGEISGVVITPYGYHLITVTDKIPEHYLTYEEVKEEVSKLLTVERIRTAVAEFIEKARNSSDITIYSTP